MKKILACCLLVVVSCSLFAQQSRREKLQQLKTREDIKVTEVEKDLLKLEYRNGKTLYKNIGDYKPPNTNNLQKTNYSPTYDSTIIDLTTIDITLYYQKYNYWQEVPLTNFDFSHIMIGDVNNNGKTELYGARKFFETPLEPVSVYELNSKGEFKYIYQYDSAYSSWNIYDVDNDGKNEVHLRAATGEQKFFSKVNDTSLATQLSFNLDFEHVQLNDQTLGDFDGDKLTDLIFVRFGIPSVYIFEYNPITTNFDSVYRFDVVELAPPGNSGFSIGDFDLDKKSDMVFSTGLGNVFVLENEGDDKYNNSWKGKLDIHNAYIHTWSHDIDKNGKPEFWILGDGFFNGVGTTRISILETNGDNSYQVVGKVDLVGVFSFYTGTMQVVDIDNDGVDEVAICIDDNFLILKFNGSRDHQTYELYYLKHVEEFQLGEFMVYYGAVMSDLLGNGQFEILISMNHIIEQSGYNLGKFITKIYKPDSTTDISERSQIPVHSCLKQNYPNPFNPVTNINFDLSSTINTSIKIYNILGKEITTLVEENLSAGEHMIQWNGKDQKGNLLPGGIYFIQMIAGSYQKTIKTVLLK